MASPLRHDTVGISLGTPLGTSVAIPAAKGVVLAIDYGRKRLGLALSDEQGLTARPFATWERTNRRRDLTRLRELVRSQKICRVVVGLPLRLDGSASEMSEEARAFAKRVERALGIPVVMFDERLSSWEAGETVAASRSQASAGRGRARSSGEKKKRPLDEVAAAIILRDYLNQERRSAGLPD
jgi:putative pre-16S rRNA nuclease